MDLLAAVVAVLAYERQSNLSDEQRRRLVEARTQIWNTAELQRIVENK